MSFWGASFFLVLKKPIAFVTAIIVLLLAVWKAIELGVLLRKFFRARWTSFRLARFLTALDLAS